MNLKKIIAAVSALAMSCTLFIPGFTPETDSIQSSAAVQSHILPGGLNRTVTKVGNPYFASSQIVSGASHIQGEYTCSYMYDTLETDAEREFYDNLYTACLTVDDSQETYTATPTAAFGDLQSDRAVEVAWLFQYDHPEFFWANSRISYSSRYLSFQVYADYQDGTDRMAAKAQIEAAEQAYIDAAMEYDTAYDRVSYLFEQLQSDISYQEGDLDQSIASAFLQKKTVCAGYTKSFSLLCNAVGVDTVSVLGYLHAWNAVCLSGNWYLVDVTQGNFLLSEEELREIDEVYGLSYTITTTVNGVEKVMEVYMHDVDAESLPTYAHSFPPCVTSYNGTDGKESLSGQTPTEPPTEESTNAPLTPPSLLGDADGSGKVDALDASVILQAAAAMGISGICDLTSEQANNADVDRSGSFDAADASLILQYAAYVGVYGTISLEDYLDLRSAF